MISVIKTPTYLLVSLVLIVLNLLPFFDGGLRMIFGVLYLFFYSLVLGNWLFIKNSTVCKFVFGLMFLLILASLIGTASFYLWQLNLWTFYLTVIIIPLLLLPIIHKYPLIFEPARLQIKLDINQLILLVSYLILAITIFYLLFAHQTSEAIRTPWQVLPGQIFLLYFLATLFLFVFLIISKNSFNLLLIIIHLFMSFSVALIIYQIGFGYDPFIHRKNVELILANGTLLPKPFYYLGQYSLIIFLKNLLAVSADYLDKLLAPAMAAIYAPVTIYYAFKDNFKLKTSYLYLIILSLLAFPFTHVITTTPHALSALFFILTILFSIYYLAYPKTSSLPLLLMALFTLAVHPLAGLPLLFAVILILLFFKHQKNLALPKILRRGILWEIFLLGCLALPAAFIINSQTLSQLKVSFSFNWLISISSSVFNNPLFFYRPFIAIYDLIYNYANNLAVLFLIVIAVSVYFLKTKKQLKNYVIYLMIFAMVFINYYLLKTSVDFFSLMDYERLNYPLRVLQLSLFSLLPLLIVGGYLFFQKIFKQSSLIILLMVILLSLGATASFYLSYPRVDTIAESHGYSTSITDLKTVNFIELIQNNEPYIVLASQPVSAAALKELGFKYYYNDYFFYPVPTGNKLYQLYEDLIYSKEKTADIIATVRYLTGVNDIYLVINSYWFDAQDKIKEEKEICDKWYAIDGKNFIFQYVNNR
ncbi:hypothetical protein KJ840_04840 [Patescibacteria group bacterium]|nr:hypothetical protein [Patescibacteria group bacterium]